MIVKLLLALICLSTIQDKQVDGEKQTENEKSVAVQPNIFAQQWTAAFATNEAENLLKFYEQSDQLVARISSGVKVVGIDNLKELYESEFKEAEFLYSKTKNISSRKFDEMTILSFEHLFAIKTGEKRFQGHVQTVLVLRKSKNSWKIVDEHSSTLKDIPRLRPIE